MAFRIGSWVTRGEIDNRVRGRVTGRIWLAGKDDPVTLDLTGNCLRDLAGTHFAFACKAAEPMPSDSPPFPDQTGVVGDMTASRKVRELEVPVEEAYERKKQGKAVPEHMANSLYLEWFSERNGRVVIETTGFQVVSISDPAWRMSLEEERSQREENAAALVDFVNRVAEALEREREENDDEEPETMDEFAWERFLRESDKRSEKYGQLIEKYQDHPDAEKRIAREMGWERLDDLLDAKERSVLQKDEDGPADEFSDVDDLPLDEGPPPGTEGVDWVHDERGRVQHPVAYRAQQLGHRVIEKYREHGFLPNQKPEGAESDKDLADMMFFIHMFGAKLAGALNGVARYPDRDPGFIVACLKRSLPFFDQANRALEKSAGADLETDFLDSVRTAAFGIRAEVLDLMKRYRAEIG